MEDLPQVTISQQLKVMMHTSQQSKRKLAHITLVLATRVAAAVNPTADIQVTTVATQVCDDQVTTEVKPFKRQKIQVTVS